MSTVEKMKSSLENIIPNRIPCEMCQSHPVKLAKVLDMLRASKGMFEPTPSPNLERHHMIYLEMLNATDRCHFANPNEGLPSKSISKCEVCPAWEFSSIAEGKRHVSILHPNYVRKDIFKDGTYTCKYKDCNMVFETQDRLVAHKKNENHYLRPKRGKIMVTLTKLLLRRRERRQLKQ